MSLFQSNLREQIRKLPKFLKIIQYYSILFIRVLNLDAPPQEIIALLPVDRHVELVDGLAEGRVRVEVGAELGADTLEESRKLPLAEGLQLEEAPVFVLIQFNCLTTDWQTLEKSFSTVSKPICTSKYSLESF